MHVYNRDGELVAIPTSVTRDQIDAALKALGVPPSIGMTSVTIGIYDVTVEHWLINEDGRSSGAAKPASVNIPRGPIPEGGEGYIPLAPSKRDRAREILEEANRTSGGESL